MSNPAYLRYLPAVYAKADDGFLARYLKIFQKLLTGLDDQTLDGRRGIQELLAAGVIGNLFYSRFSFLFPKDDESFIPPISGLPDKERNAILTYFDSFIGVPSVGSPLVGHVAENANDSDALDDFNAWLNGLLDWMASWVGLALDGSWSLDKKRTVIAEIMALYRLRGTAQGMSMMLNLLLDLPMQIECYTPSDAPEPVMGTMSVDVSNPTPASWVVGNTTATSIMLSCAYQPGMPLLDGYAPWLFLVQVNLPRYSNPAWVLDDYGAQQVQTLLTRLPVLLDAIKPATTRYQMQILGGMCFQPSPVSPPPSPSLPDPQLDHTAVLGTQMLPS